MNKKSLIIFGGTFDPIHNGHLALAHKLFEVFKSEITFMPANTPPYKEKSGTSKEHRLAMLKLALNTTLMSHSPAAVSNIFTIDTRELEGESYCYSYKTLTALRQGMGVDTPIYFIIGADSLITLDTWDYWTKLLDLANFVVVNRTGYDINSIPTLSKLNQLFQQHKTTAFTNLTISHGKFYLLDFTPPPISSTLIREYIKAGQSIQNLVPEAVAAYIKQHHLYQTTCHVCS